MNSSVPHELDPAVIHDISCFKFFAEICFHLFLFCRNNSINKCLDQNNSVHVLNRWSPDSNTDESNVSTEHEGICWDPPSYLLLFVFEVWSTLVPDAKDLRSWDNNIAMLVLSRNTFLIATGLLLVEQDLIMGMDWMSSQSPVNWDFSVVLVCFQFPFTFIFFLFSLLPCFFHFLILFHISDINYNCNVKSCVVNTQKWLLWNPFLNSLKG